MTNDDVWAWTAATWFARHEAVDQEEIDFFDMWHDETWKLPLDAS